MGLCCAMDQRWMYVFGNPVGWPLVVTVHLRIHLHLSGHNVQITNEWQSLAMTMLPMPMEGFHILIRCSQLRCSQLRCSQLRCSQSQEMGVSANYPSNSR